jgi:hypothetical protein
VHIRLSADDVFDMDVGKKKRAVSLVEKYATSPWDYLAHLKQTNPSMAKIWVSCQIVSILSVLYVFFFR